MINCSQMLYTIAIVTGRRFRSVEHKVYMTYKVYLARGVGSYTCIAPTTALDRIFHSTLIMFIVQFFPTSTSFLILEIKSPKGNAKKKASV